MRGPIAALGGFVVVLFAVSIAVGPTGFAPLTAVSDLLAGRDTPMALILLELRLPRALLGVIVGGALGLAGAAMQGLLRNPLAEPGITGVSATAALAAVMTFYSGYASLTPLALPLAGIVGAGAGAALLLAIAGRDATVATLILIGAALNALAGAATALVLGLSPNPYAYFEIGTWLMGAVADRGLDHVALALPCVVLGCLPLLLARRGLDALALGEETARGLGVDPRRMAWLVISGAALAVGGAVAVSGVVGFVGLMAPHAIRPLVRYRPGASLIPSALAGAALVLVADIALRLLPTGRELPLGVMTALFGAPVLWQLAWYARRSGQTPWL